MTLGQLPLASSGPGGHQSPAQPGCGQACVAAACRLAFAEHRLGFAASLLGHMPLREAGSFEAVAGSPAAQLGGRKQVQAAETAQVLKQQSSKVLELELDRVTQDRRALQSRLQEQMRAMQVSRGSVSFCNTMALDRSTKHSTAACARSTVASIKSACCCVSVDL